jgi:hypothetical protein
MEMSRAAENQLKRARRVTPIFYCDGATAMTSDFGIRWAFKLKMLVHWRDLKQTDLLDTVLVFCVIHGSL